MEGGGRGPGLRRWALAAILAVLLAAAVPRAEAIEGAWSRCTL